MHSVNEEKKLTEKALQAVCEYGMIERGDRILVAYSGGLDSGALLYLLHGCVGSLGAELCAFHVNHCIRGAEADRDEEHCRTVCVQLGVPFFSRRADVPAYAAEHSLGTEEAARIVRYGILSSFCRENGYGSIATAHHADDNLETVLFRLARGSGVRGLCGIPPVRDEGGIRIIRPLIKCLRDEIESYAGTVGIPYVTDSTNSDESYSRNRIRHGVVPVLKLLNPSVTEAVTGLSERLAEYRDAIETVCHLPDEAFGSGGVPEAVKRERLLASYREAAGMFGITAMPEAVHLEALRRLEDCGALWSECTLPGGIRAVKERGGIAFKSERVKVDEKSAYAPLSEGLNLLPRGGVLVIKKGRSDESVKIKNASKNIYKLSIHISLKSAKLKTNIFVRKKEDGDRIFCGGMTKRVKKLFQQKRIPPETREELPVLCGDEGIIWIPGVCVRDGFSCAGGESVEEATDFFFFPSGICTDSMLSDIKKTFVL